MAHEPDFDEQQYDPLYDEVDHYGHHSPEYDVREDERVELERAERLYEKWIKGDVF